MIACILFWVCVSAMFYSYVLYPLVLKLFSAGKRENEIVFAPDDAALPNVFIVMSVHNEEKVIRDKIDSIFNTNYPYQKIRVYVGSDTSTDETNSILSEFRATDPWLVFHEFKERSGKPAVLGKLVNAIRERVSDNTNDIFIFTDANVIFTPNTIYELVKHFKNEAIAQVGANIHNSGIRKDGISLQENSYIRIENNIKFLEGLNWGSMIGAFGGCFAMRASDWTPIPPNFIVDDFFLSLHILSKGKKAILEENAVCYEDVSNEVTNEFNRKARIQAGNFQNLSYYWKLLFRFDAVAFCFFSHKVIRWTGPMLMLLAYISNIALLPLHPFYRFTFVMQNLLLVSPLIDALLKRMNVHLILLRFASYFILMNAALAKGFWMYAKGIETNIWKPTQRRLNV
jgi:cellulose synthase/poly-beta-1,6-N-acetylglucosamine synthase-like glycosyltransferase